MTKYCKHGGNFRCAITERSAICGHIAVGDSHECKTQRECKHRVDERPENPTVYYVTPEDE